MTTRILTNSKWQHTQRKSCVHDRHFVTCVWQARLAQVSGPHEVTLLQCKLLLRGHLFGARNSRIGSLDTSSSFKIDGDV
jgi:hypothetical protein